MSSVHHGAEAMLGREASVTGLEVSEFMAEIARKRLGPPAEVHTASLDEVEPMPVEEYKTRFPEAYETMTTVPNPAHWIALADQWFSTPVDVGPLWRESRSLVQRTADARQPR